MDELPFEELDRLIGEINSGEKLVYLKRSSGEEVPLLFVQATSRDLQLAGHVYRKALAAAVAMELPSISDMEKMLRSRGLFTEKDEEALEKLRTKLAGQQAILAKTTRVPARRDRLKGIIKGIEKQITEILLKKEAGLEFTCERKAVEEKLLHLTWRGVRDPFTNERYWETRKDFEDERDFVFRRMVLIEYTIYIHGVQPRLLRSIARSNLWRVRYITATKTGDSLFGRSISEYTPDQLMLLYWSHYYQSIYDMPEAERPPESIIEDDDALDAYITDWHEERNRSSVAARAKNNSRGRMSAWDYNETLVMRSNEMFEDVEYSETLPERGAHIKETTVDAAPIGASKLRKRGRKK